MLDLKKIEEDLQSIQDSKTQSKEEKCRRISCDEKFTREQFKFTDNFTHLYQRIDCTQLRIKKRKYTKNKTHNIKITVQNKRKRDDSDPNIVSSNAKIYQNEPARKVYEPAVLNIIVKARLYNIFNENQPTIKKKMEVKLLNKQNPGKNGGKITKRKLSITKNQPTIKNYFNPAIPKPPKQPPILPTTKHFKSNHTSDNTTILLRRVKSKF